MVAEGCWREMSYIQQDNEIGENANEDSLEVIDRYWQILSRWPIEEENSDWSSMFKNKKKTKGINGFWSTINKTNKRVIYSKQMMHNK